MAINSLTGFKAMPPPCTQGFCRSLNNDRRHLSRRVWPQWGAVLSFVGFSYRLPTPVTAKWDPRGARNGAVAIWGAFVIGKC